MNFGPVKWGQLSLHCKNSSTPHVAMGSFPPIEGIGGVFALPLFANELLRLGERRSGQRAWISVSAWRFVMTGASMAAEPAAWRIDAWFKELLNSRQVVQNGCLETMEVTMPILLWLIGIPIPIIILLMLLHH
jgi:hypothetical protein